MIFLILGYLPSLLCGIHAVRTGRAQTWLWILVIAPLVGPAIYLFAELIPEWMGGRTAQRTGQAAHRALDPERDYRRAHEALEDAPTVGNRMRLAQAASSLDRWDEAETQWAQCVTGQWAEDPVILMGHANALLELDRHAEALARLEQLRALGKEGGTPQVALAFGRAYEGLRRYPEADDAYRYAADRVPGLEAGARYVRFMARIGRTEDARIGLAELDRRLAKIAAPLRSEARVWRDLAAREVEANRPAGADR